MLEVRPTISACMAGPNHLPTKIVFHSYPPSLPWVAHALACRGPKTLCSTRARYASPHALNIGNLVSFHHPRLTPLLSLTYTTLNNTETILNKALKKKRKKEINQHI